MMLPTHVLAGLALAAPLAALAPELAGPALLGALAGSVLPDLDLYAGHRRTLHYPTGFSLAAVPVVAATILWPAPFLVTVSFLLATAALHCHLDRYGGGLELRPWEGTSERAVYDHVRGRWRRPRRLVRYDGAPEDVGLAGLLALPLLFTFEGPVQWIVVGTLAVGIAYGLLRRRLAAFAPTVFAAVPTAAIGYVPERYREGESQ